MTIEDFSALCLNNQCHILLIDGHLSESLGLENLDVKELQEYQEPCQHTTEHHHACSPARF